MESEASDGSDIDVSNDVEQDLEENILGNGENDDKIRSTWCAARSLAGSEAAVDRVHLSDGCFLMNFSDLGRQCLKQRSWKTWHNFWHNQPILIIQALFWRFYPALQQLSFSWSCKTTLSKNILTWKLKKNTFVNRFCHPVFCHQPLGKVYMSYLLNKATILQGIVSSFLWYIVFYVFIQKVFQKSKFCDTRVNPDHWSGFYGNYFSIQGNILSSTYSRKRVKHLQLGLQAWEVALVG